LRRSADVRLGEHGDDIARHERQVVGWVVLQDHLAEVEGDERSREIGLVEPLDHRIVPIDLVGELAQIGRELSARGHDAHREVGALVVVGRNKGLLVRDQVVDAKAFAPG